MCIRDRKNIASKNISKNKGNFANKGVCYRCNSKSHMANDVKCPSIGMVCRHCGKVGYFEKCCRNKTPQSTSIRYQGAIPRTRGRGLPAGNVSNVDVKETTGIKSLYGVYALHDTFERHRYLTVQLINEPVEMLVDTGSNATIITNSQYKLMLKGLSRTSN